MLPLESKEWASLTHAYGADTDTPELLSQLAQYPIGSNYEDEPFFSLWSSLCHQGDAYNASYAAVPHIINLALSNPDKITYNYILLPICVEIARAENRAPVLPAGLRVDYELALSKIPELVSRFAEHADASSASVCSATIALCVGHLQLGKAILELTDDVLEDFEAWLDTR